MSSRLLDKENHAVGTSTNRTCRFLRVVGGTTFVSKYVAYFFVNHGYEVYVLNRNSKPQVKGVTLITGDRHHLGDILKGMHFDIVADITAYDAQDIIDLYHALGSFEQYIMISSSAVYPEYGVQPFLEESERNSNIFWGKYGTDKIDAENVLLERVPDAYILRPPYLYGPMNNVYREAFVFDCAMAGRKFYLPKDGDIKLQFFHIRDLCKLMEVIITNHPSEHILNVGNSEAISIKDWVTKCYACFDKVPTFVNVYDDIEQRNYFSFHNYEYYLDVQRQNKVYTETISLEEGLIESAQWYLENEADVNKKSVFVRKGTLFMTAETETIKVQILSTGNAEILLEENDFLIVKWIKPEIKYSMAAYQYGKTGMANNYPWECSLTEEQVAFFLEHINAAVEYFKSKHHYFHLEVNEVSYENIVSIDEHGIKFSDLHWLTYKECTINFNRKYPNSRGNCIGERNITAEPPYIELYSTYAHTKILFNKKGLFRKNKNMMDFHNLQRHINEFGYTTLDLS